MTETRYIAYILDTDGESTVETDLRSLSTDKLGALRGDAIANGDTEMAATIDELLAR
jgi:hypothetical protein